MDADDMARYGLASGFHGYVDAVATNALIAAVLSHVEQTRLFNCMIRQGIRWAIHYPIEIVALFTAISAVVFHELWAKSTHSAFWTTYILPHRPAFLISSNIDTHLPTERIRAHRVTIVLPKNRREDQMLVPVSELARMWEEHAEHSSVSISSPPAFAMRPDDALPLTELLWQDVCVRSLSSPTNCVPPELWVETLLDALRVDELAVLDHMEARITSLSWIFYVNVTSLEQSERAWMWSRNVLSQSASVSRFDRRMSLRRVAFDGFSIHSAENKWEIDSSIPELDRGVQPASSRLGWLLFLVTAIISHAAAVVQNANAIEVVVVAAGYVLAMVHLSYVFLWLRRCGSQFTLFVMTMLSAVTAFGLGLLSAHAVGEAAPFFIIGAGLRSSTSLIRTVMLSTGSAITHATIRSSKDITHGLQMDVTGQIAPIIANYALRCVALSLGMLSGIEGIREVSVIAAFALAFHLVFLFTFHPAVLALKLNVMKVRVSKQQRRRKMSSSEPNLRRRDTNSFMGAYLEFLHETTEKFKHALIELLSKDVMSSVASPSTGNEEVSADGGSSWEEDVFDPSVAKFKLLLGILFVGTQVFGVLSTIHPEGSVFNAEAGTNALKITTPIARLITSVRHLFSDAPIVLEAPDSIVFVPSKQIDSSLFTRHADTARELLLSIIVHVGSWLDSLDPMQGRLIALLFATMVAVNILLWKFYSARLGSTSKNASQSNTKFERVNVGVHKNTTLTRISKSSQQTRHGSEDLRQMTDDQVLELVATGKLQTYSLESRLGDLDRAVLIRRRFVEGKISQSLDGLPSQGYDYASIQGKNCENVIGYTTVPVGVAGPLVVDDEQVFIPMATTEGCLVASTTRGCKAICQSGGAMTAVLADAMTRGPVVRFPNVARAADCKLWLDSDEGWETMRNAFQETTRFGRLVSIQVAVAGHLVYIRFAASTGDAMGMNMVSKGSERCLEVLSQMFTDMEVVSLSGNYCTDKKASAINWIQGRGKSVVAEVIIPSQVVGSVLKTTVERMVDLNTSKNLVGSAMSGTSAGGFNAHAANIVAAVFLACGQDLAQVVASSNCITLMSAVKRDDGTFDLRVSCTMPSLEVGTVGGGTQLSAQEACLRMLGVQGPSPDAPGDHAQKLARIICAAVLAGEINLCAALAEGALVKSHLRLNRGNPSVEISHPVREDVTLGTCSI